MPIQMTNSGNAKFAITKDDVYQIVSLSENKATYSKTGENQ
jgi:hypothetical protein